VRLEEQPQYFDQLEQRLREARNNLDRELIQNSFDGMVTCARKCIVGGNSFPNE